MDQYNYLQLSNAERQRMYANQLAAQQNMNGMNGMCGIGLFNNRGMMNALAPVQGPYKSNTMNAKLAAAKKWLAEKNAI